MFFASCYFNKQVFFLHKALYENKNAKPISQILLEKVKDATMLLLQLRKNEAHCVPYHKQMQVLLGKNTRRSLQTIEDDFIFPLSQINYDNILRILKII